MMKMKQWFLPRVVTWMTGNIYYSPWDMSVSHRVVYTISMLFSITIVAILAGSMWAGATFAAAFGFQAINIALDVNLVTLFWMSFGLGFTLIFAPFVIALLRFWFSPKARRKAREVYASRQAYKTAASFRGVNASNVEIVTPQEQERRRNKAAWAGEEVVDAEYEEVVDPNRTLH